GNNYNALIDSSTTPNIDSSVNGNLTFSRPNQGVVTNPGAFTQNTTAGGALRQIDNYQDGSNGLGGVEDDGNWRFLIDGNDLPNYEGFRVYFQARRVNGFGNNKRIRVDFRTPNVNGGNWVNGSVADNTILNLPTGNNGWVPFTVVLPPGVNNPDNLEIRLQVNDGSTYDYGDYNCY